MKLHRECTGQTLLELLLAMGLGSVIIAATVAYFQPAVRAFQGLTQNENLRIRAAGPMDIMEKDASNVRAIYVDPNQCYTVCMVDGGGNRIYYYWDPAAKTATKNLLRKTESSALPIACKGGAVFAEKLDSSKTSFAMNKDLLNVTMTAPDPSGGAPFTISSSIFPTVQERQVILSEGFECASLRQGWVVNNGAQSTWGVVGGAQQGNYQIAGAESKNGTDTATIEIPVDLSRVANAHISFNYMNDGPISNKAPSDSFSLALYDGTAWRTIFSDNTGTLISGPRSVEADLSAYALNRQNRIRFSGTLKKSTAHWYVDAISVFNP